MHFIILTDPDGLSYRYYPKHLGDRHAAEELPAAEVKFLTGKEAKKALKKSREQSEIPPALLEKAQELFG